jgi:hypothetical protein
MQGYGFLDFSAALSINAMHGLACPGLTAPLRHRCMSRGGARPQMEGLEQ